jgi:hypothetical protein
MHAGETVLRVESIGPESDTVKEYDGKIGGNRPVCYILTRRKISLYKIFLKRGP